MILPPQEREAEASGGVSRGSFLPSLLHVGRQADFSGAARRAGESLFETLGLARFPLAGVVDEIDSRIVALFPDSAPLGTPAPAADAV